MVEVQQAGGRESVKETDVEIGHVPIRNLVDVRLDGNVLLDLKRVLDLVWLALSRANLNGRKIKLSEKNADM